MVAEAMEGTRRDGMPPCLLRLLGPQKGGFCDTMHGPCNGSVHLREIMTEDVVCQGEPKE